MVARGLLPPAALLTMQCTLEPPNPKLEIATKPPFHGVGSVTTCAELRFYVSPIAQEAMYKVLKQAEGFPIMWGFWEHTLDALDECTARMLRYHSEKLKLKRPALSTPLVRLVLLGLGALKCRFPGIVRCSNARQTLMRAAQQQEAMRSSSLRKEGDLTFPHTSCHAAEVRAQG